VWRAAETIGVASRVASFLADKQALSIRPLQSLGSPRLSHAAIRLDGECAVAVELNFLDQSRPVHKFGDGAQSIASMNSAFLTGRERSWTGRSRSITAILTRKMLDSRQKARPEMKITTIAEKLRMTAAEIGRTGTLKRHYPVLLLLPICRCANEL
jgi:hypothetical protein